MPSLTPQYRADEASEAAMMDGLLAGGVTMIPSSLGVWAATHSRAFMKSTNYQSRTALVIMPALFMFALSSETKLHHKMHEIAQESEHSKNIVEWSTATQKKGVESENNSSSSINNMDAEKQITALYRKSVEESGVRIITSDRLGPHHIFANFWQEHPFKLLAMAGVPTVLYIFKGRNANQNLQLQSKLMHTRVFGQFALISMLLTLMGFKEYMDKYGRFITQADADQRVLQLQRMRQDLMERVKQDKKMKEYREDMIRNAHQQDVNNNNNGNNEIVSKKLRKKKMKEIIAIDSID
eukprot:CAMPEP_0197828636 /NCGR_PEP_ID=MMETSP1437-20131217/5170_1 /TAXON_ID=49252 ORGANISM="Eucampia antarctica, Strain CCMP1452" /NCGR_SAMPLE_ID=MMETSP1437 /ASSEMBLY_ACC=CAM_ASM_001096 /LENGTH=295 /DNA_ID=CAMNT_0043429923 /DNA_START=45 /DNA_END=932 /DNA_ORIENTATION=-